MKDRKKFSLIKAFKLSFFIFLLVPAICFSQTIKLGEEEPQGEIEEEEEPPAKEAPSAKEQEDTTPFHITPKVKKEEKAQPPALAPIPPPPIPPAGGDTKTETETKTPPVKEEAKPSEPAAPKEGDQEAGAPPEGTAKEETQPPEEAKPEQKEGAVQIEPMPLVKISLEDLKLPDFNDSRLNELLKELATHIKTENYSAAHKAVDEIVVVRDSLGYILLPDMSAYLIFVSSNLRKIGNRSESFLFAMDSVKLSPLMAAPYLARAHARFAISKTDFIGFYTDFSSALDVAVYDFPFVSYVASKFFSFVAVGGLIFVLLLALALLIRHGSLAVYDLYLLFPPKVPTYQVAILFGVLVFMPFIIGIGIFAVIGLLFIILACYATPTERFTIVMALLFLMCFSIICSISLTLADRDSDMSYTLWKTLTGPPPQTELAELENYHKNFPNNPLSLAAMGAVAKRKGDLKTAENLYTEALKIDSNFISARVNLANILFLKNDIERAKTEYGNVIKTGKVTAQIWFNIAQIHKRLLDSSKANENLERARLSSSYTVKFLESRHAEDFNRYVFDDVPSVMFLLKRMWERFTFMDRQGDSISSFVLGNLPQRQNWILLGICIFLVLVLPKFSGKLKLSAHCGKCNHPASLRDNPEMPNKDLCGQCFHLYVTRQVVDPQAKQKKEIDIRRYFFRDQALLIFLSFIPGMSYLYTGSAIAGATLTAVSSFLISVLLADGLLPDPITPGVEGKLAIYLPMIVIALILYLLSLIHYKAKRA